LGQQVIAAMATLSLDFPVYGGDVSVEVFMPSRRVGFTVDAPGDPACWFIATMPPSPVDGAGLLSDTTIDAVLSRARP
jgi:hypothetical protein